MTFPASAGYGNLPNGVWDPVIYSADYLEFFRTISVVEEITNTDYTGEIKDKGSSVKIMKEPLITVRPYERGTKIVPQDLLDEDITMVCDQANYTSFVVDDIEELFAHNAWASKATSSAAYALKNDYDQNVLTYMAGLGTNTTALGTGTDAAPVTIGFNSGDTFTPLNYLARMARILDENDVPEEGRFVTANPIFYELLGNEDSKLIEVQVTGDRESLLRSRKIGARSIHGFTMLKSNNLTASASAHKRILFGHVSATATAKALTKDEVIRSAEFFGDMYRGLLVFGRKLLRPEALFTGHYDASF